MFVCVCMKERLSGHSLIIMLQCTLVNILDIQVAFVFNFMYVYEFYVFRFLLVNCLVCKVADSGRQMCVLYVKFLD